MSRSTAEPDRTDESTGVTPAWVGGLVLSGIGVGLAVISLTLPWISVLDADGSPVQLPVTGLVGHGPVFAVLLVGTALLAAVGFAVGRRAVATLRVVAVLSSGLAVTALFVGSRPNYTALPKEYVESWNERVITGPTDLPVSPTSGLALYVVGLLLVGLGLAVGSFSSSGRITLIPTPGPVAAPRRKALVRWIALIAAVPLVVLSLALAWFEVDTTSSELPAVAHGWPAVYRAGLAATLLCLVGTALAVGGLQRLLRSVGLYLGGGLVSVLYLNALLLWDPSELTEQFSVELDRLHAGPAYFAAIAAVPLLLLVLAMSAPPDTDDAAPGHPDRRSAERDGAAE